MIKQGIEKLESLKLTNRTNLSIHATNAISQSTIPSWVTFQNQIADLLDMQGQYNEAELYLRECMRFRIEHLGDAHLDTLKSMNSLAGVLDEQGHYEEAEALYRDCLKTRIEQLGDKHPDTLKSLNGLALVLDHQRRYIESVPLYQECLRLRKEHLGETHPDTLSSMNNWASKLCHQRRHFEAEPLYRECYKLRKKHLGDTHPHTLTSMNNLAGVWFNQGRYIEAEPLYRDCLRLYREQLGDTHPHTMDTMYGLIFLLENMWGRKEEADELRREWDELTLFVKNLPTNKNTEMSEPNENSSDDHVIVTVGGDANLSFHNNDMDRTINSQAGVVNEIACHLEKEAVQSFKEKDMRTKKRWSIIGTSLSVFAIVGAIIHARR